MFIIIGSAQKCTHGHPTDKTRDSLIMNSLLWFHYLCGLRYLYTCFLLIKIVTLLYIAMHVFNFYRDIIHP